jgi:putative copper export protein
MSSANLQILLMVIALVIVVLGLGAAGMYWLNKSVDQSDA